MDHLEDLDADFLRFYNIDGFDEMHSVRFFALAMRVMAYDGVITKHVQYEQEQNTKKSPAKAVRTGQAKQTPVSALGSDIIEVRQ